MVETLKTNIIDCNLLTLVYPKKRRYFGGSSGARKTETEAPKSWRDI